MSVLTAAKLVSPDGRYFAQVQDDGNLVVYDHAGRAVRWLGVDPAPVPLPEPEPSPVPTPPRPPLPEADILDVKCNFCSSLDPLTNQVIFQNQYPSQDATTRRRWLDSAHRYGDTHFQIGNCTTAGNYHGPATDWLKEGRMGGWVTALREVAAEFHPIVFAHSGDRYPGAGYHAAFIDAIPDDLVGRCIFVCGHETVAGGYTTAQFVAANQEMWAGGAHLLAAHLSDGRLSFSSNPVEPDDPWQGDEIACWRSSVGALFTFYFHQSANLREGESLDPNVEFSTAERMMECVTRVDGTRWHGAPDWFAGLDHRPIPVLWEQSEELYYRGEVSRDYMLKVWAAAKAMGYRGYGCGGAA
jgi:hypothetical protein